MWCLRWQEQRTPSSLHGSDKSAVANVPQVIGSMFADGLWLLVGGVGALAGIGGTLGTQLLLKKRKSKA